jgi:phenylpropionate dioxygenase-like ring-hydroxylating dioxygenase large terminal subunit
MMLVTKQAVLRRFWYPIMPTSHLGAEPKPFTLLGENIVLWKTADGSVGCLQDRCCHRTAKLSLGMVEDGNIVCGYHGWTYAPDGACVRIPQEPSQPISPRYRVASYRTAEKYGYLWVALGQPLNGIPEFPEAAQAGFRKIDQFYEPWNIGALRLMENSFDSAHIAYVHRNTFGNVASPEVKPRDIVQNPWGFESSTSSAVKVRGDAAHRAVQTTEGDTVRQSTSVWYMPFIRRTQIRYPHGLIHVLITCATPIDDRCSMILQWVYRNDTEEQVSTADVIAFDRAITLEDKAIIESCDPDVPLSVIEGEEHHMLSDRPGLIMRRMLSSLLREHGESEQRVAS